VLREDAICYGDIASAGWTDEQDPARTGLQRRDDDAFFGDYVGPQSAKRYLFPPSARPQPGEPEPAQKLALIGGACLRTARDRDTGPRVP
jgi:hypothetical protein